MPITQLSIAIILSLLHGLIPSHWLPVVAIGKSQGWSQARVLRIASIASLAHSFSTILIGVLVALLGSWFTLNLDLLMHWIPAIILIVLGIWFLYRHYTHHHFHLEPHSRQHKGIIWALLLAMFLSPCLEIEGYFFLMGSYGWIWVALLSGIYLFLSLASTFFWVWLAWKGAQKINAHRWEHSSGIITGLVLLASGVLFLFT